MGETWHCLGHLGATTGDGGVRDSECWNLIGGAKEAAKPTAPSAASHSEEGGGLMVMRRMRHPAPEASVPSSVSSVHSPTWSVTLSKHTRGLILPHLKCFRGACL